MAPEKKTNLFQISIIIIIIIKHHQDQDQNGLKKKLLFAQTHPLFICFFRFSLLVFICLYMMIIIIIIILCCFVFLQENPKKNISVESAPTYFIFYSLFFILGIYLIKYSAKWWKKNPPEMNPAHPTESIIEKIKKTYRTHHQDSSSSSFPKCKIITTTRNKAKHNTWTTTSNDTYTHDMQFIVCLLFVSLFFWQSDIYYIINNFAHTLCFCPKKIENFVIFFFRL